MTRRGFFASAAAAGLLAACTGGPQHADSAEIAYPAFGQFLTVEGLRIHYIDVGQGPVVVLVHGANGNIRDWTFSMVDRLKDRYRVIAIDRPGHGYSQRPNSDGANPATQARLIAGVLDQLGINRYVLAGHSWGGAVVTAWGLQRPEQVAGMMVLAGATYSWNGGPGLLYTLGASPLGGVVNAVARSYVSGDRAASMVSEVFKPNAMPAGYADYIGVELALRPDTFIWNAEDIKRLSDFLAVQSQRYVELTMPMEVIHGDADKTVLFDIHSVPLAATAPNARLTKLAGVGHMPHHVAQGTVIDALDRLVSQAG
jgi:pimeloyl-ACP methyl ester carboxylesterase